MTPVDTVDGCFKSVACGWAFARPVRKVHYNLVITGLPIAGRGSDLAGTDVRTLVSDRMAVMRFC
jgi:nickel/cobalt transporter (NiCoT) family protein